MRGLLMRTESVVGTDSLPSTSASREGRPISVVHIVSPGRAGGLETVVHALARGHAAAGHTVHVVSVSNDVADREFLDRFDDTGVHTESLGVRGRGYWRERAAARAFLRSTRPDIVHTHGNRPDVVDAPVARELGVPTVTTIHGYTDSTPRNRLYGLVQRMSLPAFDAVVAVSRPLATQLAARVDRLRLHVIPNAFIPRMTLLDRTAARRRLGVHDDRFLIGWVGRMSREKAPDIAIAAMHRLANLAPGAAMELAMIGDGPEREGLQARCRKSRIESLVRWHGLRHDAARLMAGFDLFVLSSRTEGTPMVILEAMAAHTPIVATRVGGVPDVVSADESLLVPRDNPDALAAAMLRVMHEPTSARARANRAAEIVATRYDGSAWLDRYATLYSRLRLQVEHRGPC